MNPARRVAMFGLDGLDISLVQRWTASGDLPNFKDLLNSSAWSSYVDPPQHSSGTIWASAHTGHQPLDHDLFFDKRIVTGSYKTRLGRASDCKKPPFWEWFARSGRNIHIIDIPFFVPNPQWGGKQIHGWCPHDMAWRRDSVPKDFLRKQIKKHGEHPVRSCHNYTAEADSIKRMCGALIEGIEQRTRMYMELLSGDDWDFYYAAISEGHCASHLMWHLCDDGHPAFSDVLAQELRQPLLRVYRAIDRGIGELRRVAGENCSFVIYLTHGIGANYSAVSVFPDILREFNANWAGDRKGKKNSAEASSSSTLDKIWQATVGKLPVAVRGDLKRYIPINLRAWITQKRKENVARKRSSLSHSVAQDGFSAVRVNLLGREPAGLILAGSEYTEYVDALVAELSSLVNIDTGEPVLGQVFRADTHLDPLELTGGNDLTIWWSKAAPIRAVKSATLGRFDTETKEKRTGEHIMHGALIINDSRFEAGNRNITGMSVIDVAPTICELAGVEPGEPLPGKSRIAEFKASASGTNLG